MSEKAQLTLPYSVDERLGVCHLIDLRISHTSLMGYRPLDLIFADFGRLGVCHLIDLCISHTIKAFDTENDPVTGCGECIDLVFYVR